MKFYFTPHLLTAAVALSFAGVAAAQSYSPGTTYANPATETTNAARQRGPCGDPWVTIALERVYGRAEQAQCNVKLYNNGQWDSYNTLVHAVAKAKSSGGDSTASAKTVTLTRIKYDCPKTQVVCTIFSNEGDKVGILAKGVFQPDASSLVNAGGLNLVGQDGGTILSNANAGVVPTGAGSMIAQKINLNPPASPLRGYALQGVSDFRSLQEKSRSK